MMLGDMLLEYLKPKLENIISGYRINEDDASWLLSLLSSLREKEREISDLSGRIAWAEAAYNEAADQSSQWRNDWGEQRRRAEAAESQLSALIEKAAQVAKDHNLICDDYVCGCADKIAADIMKLKEGK